MRLDGWETLDAGCSRTQDTTITVPRSSLPVVPIHSRRCLNVEGLGLRKWTEAISISDPRSEALTL